MRVLVIGGSGYVAGLVLPFLAEKHTLRVFDLALPTNPVYDYHQGSINDPAALLKAAEGMDALLYMAMGILNWDTDEGHNSSFDVNVKGVYLALRAAHLAGISHAVYTSSMSVYEGDLFHRHFHDEDIAPDCSHLYGLTKRMGEESCRAASRTWGMTINALRLCLPQSEERWLAETKLGTPTIATTAPDLARALLAALEFKGAGFEAFTISGDYEQTCMNMSKARRLLHWEPLARPVA